MKRYLKPWGRMILPAMAGYFGGQAVVGECWFGVPPLAAAAVMMQVARHLGSKRRWRERVAELIHDIYRHHGVEPADWGWLDGMDDIELMHEVEATMAVVARLQARAKADHRDDDPRWYRHGL